VHKLHLLKAAVFEFSQAEIATVKSAIDKSDTGEIGAVKVAVDERTLFIIALLLKTLNISYFFHYRSYENELQISFPLFGIVPQSSREIAKKTAIYP